MRAEVKVRNKLERKRLSDIPPEMRLRKCSIAHRRWHPELPMAAEVVRTATSYAEILTLEMPETEESLFVSALVRKAISKRASESRYPLGWLDQERLDKVVAKFAHRRQRVPTVFGILIGLVRALIASMALIRAGSTRRGSGTGRATVSTTTTISTAAPDLTHRPTSGVESTRID